MLFGCRGGGGRHRQKPFREREEQTPATDTGEIPLQREKNDRRQRHNDRQAGPHLDKVLRLVATGPHDHHIALMGEREDKGATGAVCHGEKRHADIDAARFRCGVGNRREDNRCGGVVRRGAEQRGNGKQHAEHLKLTQAHPRREQGRRQFARHAGLEECVAKGNRTDNQKEDG